jgi:hypothetical protein
MWRTDPLLGKDLETNEYSLRYSVGEYKKTAVCKQRIGKYAPTTVSLLLEMVFSIRSVQSGYEEEIWGNQCSWGLAVQINSAREATVELRVESPAVKKNVGCKSAAVKRFYVCSSCSETYNYRVKIRCLDTTSED